jgi:amino acid adenylation domain-containing protein/non-ribosomal peptide synthase protein (TIGR01720 family)
VLSLEEKRRLIAEKLAKKAQRGDSFPLSYAQHRLWVVQQMDPASVAYNQPHALRLRGALDVEVLGRALTALVRRHETLRTVFPAVDGAPVQRVLPAGPVEPAVTDLRALPEAEREAQAARLARDEAARPFDLATGPLLRVSVLRMGDADTTVLFTTHHIVSDGWSRDVLVRELSELYSAFAEGREPALPPLPIQYADYAAWQRGWLTGPVLEQHLDYWRGQLAGAPPLLELPTDRPRAAVAGTRAEHRSFALSAEASEALRALARGEGATLFMTLLGAWQLLLARWSGGDDVVVGTPVAGRSRLETENLIGFFVNMLALRTNLSGDPTYRALVGRVRQAVLGAQAHQELPFDKLVDELQPERGAASHPVFQVAFSLQPPVQASLRLGAVEVAGAGSTDETAKFDLSLAMGEAGGRIGGSIVYRAELFDGATIERMARQLVRVLEQAAAHPDVRLSRIQLIDGDERGMLVDAWNHTDRPFPRGICIHERFEAQVRARPDAPALLWDGLALTYAELDARANRLAHHLRRHGVGPDARVGVLLERGAELIVSLLAILKAGGCYVPLDPGYPAERLRLMLADSAARVLVTRLEHGDVVMDVDVPLVLLDESAAALAAESAGPVVSGATAENLAYIVYTSGSTGRPKGVMVGHGNVVQLVVDTDYVQLGPGDRIAQASNASFDALAFETWGALLNGATLVGIPRDVLLSPPALRDLLRAERITTLYQTTALLNQLSREQPDIFAPLREVLFGGQAVDADSVRRVLKAGKPQRLLHMYGPTETTAWCSYETVEAVADDALTVSVGRPTGNQRIYVLDARLEPAPLGVPGEGYVGGAGVVRGYLDRPGLTAERFVPDPFAAEPGARMYRTGDRLRWTADGALEFVGRLDAQVKIRGFRIEPGEIESVLSAHGDVREARVVVREDAPGEKRLVAYVVGDADAEALRAHLRRSLPEYMVPAAFVGMDALPLTPAGKLDTKALPAPDLAAKEDRYVAPRTPVEEALAGIWAEVLRLERVGVGENFFELGGDSILCIQVASRARRAGVEITPRQMFEHPTIGALAAVANQRAAADAPKPDQGRVAGTVKPTPIQAWFLEQDQPAPAHHNQSVLLEVDASVSDDALAAALPAVAEHHDALRLRFRRTASGWEQSHADAAGIQLERIDLSGMAPAEQDRAQGEIAQARQTSLDLEHGPLGRAVCFDRGPRGRVLLLILHHLVVDGVSWRILREDLEQACAQLQRGEPVDLGPKTTSYRQWSQALDGYAASEALGAEAAYWLAQGADGVAPLPVDGQGGRTVGGARSVVVRLDADETRALLQEVPAAYRTQINDVLLCALAEAVGAWTGTPRIRLALEGHGREEEVAEGMDLTRTVGWFTSVYPVVLDVDGAADADARLKRVKEQLRAVPTRGIGYGVLRYRGGDEVRTALAAQPEPEISFNYLGQFDQGMAVAERFRFAAGPQGRDSAAENLRHFPLAVNGSVAGGGLQLSWTYDEGTHRRETIERVAADYLAALRGLVAHCRRAGAGGCTPSDFPLAEVTQGELDALTAGRRVEDLYPLSPLQEGLLFHALYGGGAQAYQVQTAQRLEGPLDPGLLQRAWARVVARHAVLRTSFVTQGVRRAHQRVEAAVEVPWRVEDWRHLPDAEQEAALERYMAEDRARGFALDEAPLLRCALFRAADDAWWIAWNQHHLLLDGWASFRLRSEVFRVYGALTTGEPLELPRVRPYRDYIAWLGRQDPAAAESFWRGVLGGFTAATPLPADRTAGDGAEPRHARRSIELPAELTQRLEETARQAQVTLNTVVQGAWGLLLSRYSGEEDVVFGNTVSGRPAALDGVEEMVGLFINTLPVRMRVRGDARVGAWLAELQRAQAEAREYEYAPLVQVQGWSDVPRGTPLFESQFVFENYPVEHAGGAAAEGTAAQVRVTRGRAVEWTTYPLSLTAAPGHRLYLRLAYDENRFHAATTGRMLGHLARILAQVAERVDRPLSALTLMDEAERRTVVEEWNATAAPFPAEGCIHELFEAQAARTPDAVALTFGGHALTYREVDTQANRLAHHLRRLGVGPEVRVGLCLERGLEMMSAILGVMKAGGAYVPVDPGHPVERIAYVLGDSAVRVLLTQERLRERMPVDARVRIVCVDHYWPRVRADGDGAPVSGVGPENLAYVIYTSGSTGRPKGVAMHHRGVCNYIHWGMQAYGTDAGNGAPVFSSMAVDLTITNLLPLFAGHPVHFLPEENAVEALAQALREGPRYGLIKITPTHLSLLTPLLSPEQARAAAATLVIGADFLPAEPTVWWQENAPGVRLMNEYGPTETVVGCSAYVLPNGVHRHGPVPVGGPIANLTFYVLDAHLQPAPIGVPGELYIGGVGVARGYLGRPGLSAEKFVPDPFAGGGDRMYRTGDRARWMDGGNLMILGRTDNQVKVRGYRVELGEIEAVLRRHDAVSGAIVVVREDVPGDRRLVAYVVSDAEPAALREYLRGELPEYMVPSAFVRLESLPDTATGKVDPKTLPAPEYVSAEAEHVAPRTPAEEVLAGIWAEVLGVERVGATDNFFELGGHSLLATRVASRVREVFAAELPVRALFEAPTVAGLALRVEALARGGQPAAAPPLVPVPRGDGLPLSFAQQRLWFIEQLRPGQATYNIPVALKLWGALDVPALERALAELVRRHEVLRTTFRLRGGEPVQVVAPPAPVPVPLTDLRHLAPDAREAAARKQAADEAARPFDLASEPPLRVALARLEDEAWALSFTMHHVASDGWSMGVLVREVSALYNAFAQGEPSPLAEPPVQYGDFAAWQRARLAGDVLDAQIAWWRQALAGAPPLLELPTDRPRPLVQGEAAGRRALRVPDATAAALRELARKEGATLFMVLLAAWQALLGRYAGVHDVSVGTPIAGRTRLETEGLIGFFVNTLVLRTDLSGDPDFRGLLARVRESTLGAYGHQDVPFEKLVEELHPERSLSHTPLFQVLFTLQNTAREALHLGPLRAQAVDAGSAAAKFDLSLTVAEEGEVMVGSLAYRAELFDAATMDQLLEHYRVLLAAVAEHPARRISQIGLLDDGERARLAAWNRTDAPLPDERRVHRVISAQAARTPDAAALIFGEESVSYAELERRANRLAQHLVHLGAGPEARVGVCLERSAGMVVALLAVLKAGAAYVPLDPAYPADRVAFMLADSGTSLLLTSAALRGRFHGADVRIVDVEGDAAAVAAAPAEAPRTGVEADNAAYVIYTSGSTGRPKGVQVTHANVTSFFAGMDERVGGTIPGTWLAVTRVSFDIHVLELLWTLARGFRVVILPDLGQARGDETLPRQIRRHGVTHLQCTPSLAAAVLDETGGEGLAGLQRVLLGGEALPAGLAARITALLPGGLVNLYGPTETTVWSATHAVEAGEGVVPIGRPIANTRIHVLDAGLRAGPAGVAGELCIAGAGVARGYRGRAGLTAERFVPDPFAPVPGARMYRTGDRARWRADGTLEYLGRMDEQVKVRGFRIEPGEIEAALRGHPGVRDCAVAVRGAAGGARLVAYVVGEVDAEALRVHLRRTLPDYMVPGQVVGLDALPLTPNGKLDRRALPAPPAAAEGERRLAPGTDLEARLAALWAGLLGVDEVGVEDNFFDLGGHSLLLLRLQARLAGELGRDVPLVELFQYPTVRALAARLQGGGEAPSVAEGEARAEVRQDAVGRRLEAARRRRGG